MKLIARIFKRKSGCTRKQFGKWIAKNIGAEYVEEALGKYDALCSGKTIGGFYETLVFLDMIEKAGKGKQE